MGRPRFVAGRTLIELLVAIGLGLLILLGVGSLFLGANQSSRVARNVAASEETGQVVLATIGAAVQRAGYSEIVGTSDFRTRNDLMFAGAHVRGCDGAGFVNAAAGNFACNASVAGASDVLMVAFQADNVISSPQSATLDCLGQAAPLLPPNPSFSALAATIPVVQNIYFVTPAGELQCLGNGSAIPATLAVGVARFKVFFGFDDVLHLNPLGSTIDRPTARSLRPGSYIDALPNPGPATTRWDYVVSVVLCVELNTQEAGVATTPTAGSVYRRCPLDGTEAAGGVQTAPVPADGAIRRAYSQVVSLRSQIAPQAARILGPGNIDLSNH